MTPSTQEKRTVPLPPIQRTGHPLGAVGEMQRDTLAFSQRAARLGPVVRFRVAASWWYQVSHPDGVRRVLQENNHNYPKSDLTKKVMGPILRDGLFTSEGSAWLRQRRLMQPQFHRRSVAAFGEIMGRTTHSMLERWEGYARSGTPVDVSEEATRLALGIVTDALFHTHLGDEPEIIGRAMDALVEEINYRFQVPFYPPMWVPTARNRRMREARDTLDRVVQNIIEEKRRDGAGEDLLALLMHARDEVTGETMPDAQLRDEVKTLLVAGHETTANALSWAFYLLARHPEAEGRLREELEGVLGPGDRAPTLADLPRLPYARRVLDETIRLYPPAWITDRQALGDDVVCGHRVPAGTRIVLLPYVTHRHPDLWEDPDRFDPDRFLPERSAGRPRFAYFPFGGGPRQCIGRDMALAEAHLVLASVLRRFRLRPASGEPVEPQPLVTLRPKGGVRMFVEPAPGGGDGRGP